jgi:hypothetical protein
MILTVRELVNHLGMNPKTEFVGASILVRTLERLGAIKKVGTRPFLDDNGKPTIGRPSALYEFPETVTFDFPSEALEFVPKAKKAKKAKVSVPEVDVVDADLSEVVAETVVDDEPVVAETVETEPETVERDVVAETVETEPETVERDEVVAEDDEDEDEDEEVDFSSDSLLEQFLRESA